MIQKNYPYLKDPYQENINNEYEKYNFLKEIDNFVNQKQYVKITLLNWEEEPIQEIQGEISSGTISKDGSSSVRRTGQITASFNSGEYNIETTKSMFSINKKIFIEVGVKNYSNKYKEYPILWFPQGVFFITDFSISSSTSSVVTVSLQLRDKMAKLNGDIGGVFPSTTILDEMDTQSPSGEYITKKVTIYDIILEVVNHFGNEPLTNIIIEDLDTRIKQVLQWRGSNPLYLIPNINPEDGSISFYEATLSKPESGNYTMYSMGEDVGYIYTDFVWTGELVASPGDTITSVLDKIKNALGNYEYFYDEYGIFHFREIKNYLNTTQGKILLDSMNKNDYLIETNVGKSVYTFSDNTGLISLSCSPKYSNIKNDFIIHGTKKMTNSDISYDIMYHLAIDDKPILESDNNTQIFFDLLFYKEEETKLVKGVFPYEVEELPTVGDFNIIYKYGDKFYYWQDSSYKEVEKVAYYGKRASENDQSGYRPKDWRTYLYIYGLLAQKNGTDEGHYFDELSMGWPQIYDLVNQKFYEEDLLSEEGASSATLTNGYYFLDFIDPSESLLGEFSVNNIGRRTKVVVNEDVNCLFQPDIPDIVFINVDNEDTDENGVPIKENEKNECIAKGQAYSQVKSDIFYAFATGGYKNGAFDQIKYELYNSTSYQKGLNLTSIPVFYLEPNTRITINDTRTNTYGDFIITNITMPLGAGSIMSVSCNEALERF